MSVLEACLKRAPFTRDTAIHEEPDKQARNSALVRQLRVEAGKIAAEKGLTAILGWGFDPGVVNAYCALAAETLFRPDRYHRHSGCRIPVAMGKYFATNFDPEINFREFIKVLDLDRRRWKEYPTHSNSKRVYDFSGGRPLPHLSERTR